jgi:hypothetical protein
MAKVTIFHIPAERVPKLEMLVVPDECVTEAIRPVIVDKSTVEPDAMVARVARFPRTVACICCKSATMVLASEVSG